MIETTDFNKSEQYTLSIRLSTDGFSFSVFNPLGDGEFSYYDRAVDESLSLTANLKQTFRELAWLERPSAVSMCSWQTNASRSFPGVLRGRTNGNHFLSQPS